MPSMLKSLKLLTDPTRLRILLLLDAEALSVADLQELLGMGQSRISTQLSQLKAGGLVTDERSGKHNFYRSEMSPALCQLATEAASELPEVTKDASALRHLQDKRRDKTRTYFDSLAGRFGKDYVPGRSWKGLAEALLKVNNQGVVADLGAGEGTLAQMLARQAERVIAVDLSPKMVEFGRDLALKHDLQNLEYRLGDIEEPPLDDESVDLAFLSQALHHAGSPDKALLQASSHVYVDVAGLIWSYPLNEVNRYIERLVKAGFGDRVMFGTDQLGWPKLMSYSISIIQNADYLTPQQKRDILYNNAARFLRLDQAPSK